VECGMEGRLDAVAWEGVRNAPQKMQGQYSHEGLNC
jgi:hypothetical protein